MLPPLTQIWTEHGEHVENVVIPLTDGMRGLQLYVNLKAAVEADGRPIVQTLEKTMTLAMIDRPEQRRPVQQPVRTGPRIGRNEPCGSGKKYKAFHGKDKVYGSNQ
jgi:hypothetical protein